MSYDIYLKDPVTKKTIELDTPHDMTGGTYCVGGTTEAWLNITHNYGALYYEHLHFEKGIRCIYGMTGAESIPVMEAAASALKNNVDPNYWAATEGNAKFALLKLIALAKLRPDGIWDGD